MRFSFLVNKIDGKAVPEDNLTFPNVSFSWKKQWKKPKSFAQALQI